MSECPDERCIRNAPWPSDRAACGRRDGRRRVLRRLGVAAVALGGLGSVARAAAARGSDTSGHAGVYQRADGGSLGLQPFVTDAGERLLLLADHRSGVVRALRPTAAAGVFDIHRGFASTAPRTGVARLRTGADAADAVLETDAEALPAGPARRLATRDVAVSVERPDARLSGTLILPSVREPAPAVVLLHGSGPLTRHSFGPYPRFFSSLGMAVLVCDKRGTGESTGHRIDASTGTPSVLPSARYPDDLVGDARAALDLLRSHPAVDAAQVGLWGSSEGGMLALQAAAVGPPPAFAINSSGFVGPLWETVHYQVRAKLTAAGAAGEEIERALAFDRLWLEVARTGQGYERFVEERRTVVPRYPPWTFYENAAFTSLAQMRWAWDHLLSFDGVPALRRVRCPVLGLFGARDLSTDAAAATAALLRHLSEGGNADISARTFEQAGHSLMETSAAGRLAPGLFPTLRGWLSARVAIRAAA